MLTYRKFIENRKGSGPNEFITQYGKFAVFAFSPSRPADPMPDKFVPVDIINELPWKPGASWVKRKLSDIKFAVFHQSMCQGTVFGINKYHISRGCHISVEGCPHLCYQYAIASDLSGTVYKCNALEDITWHTKGQNSRSIGIMIIGDFAGPGYQGKNPLSNIQRISIHHIMDYLIADPTLPNIKDKSAFKLHSDFGKPACPGFDIENEVNRLRSI